MSLKSIICLIFSFFPILAFSQDDNWMISPIQHKVGLSGTFGELRTNHFHTGVDIKSSNGRSGDPIVAVANGYISRIRITKDSYGNAIYIDHPNGKTSVYAHLLEFSPAIEDWIRQAQYGIESFEIDTSLTDEYFPILQGEEIGKMGNSGSSFGAHLHFEIRDTPSEIALNPLAHGLKVYDTAYPRMEEIRFHILDSELLEIDNIDKNLISLGKDRYTIPNGSIEIPAWRIGLSIFVRDLMNGVGNRNGIYQLAMNVDGKNVFQFTMDSISFDDMRYCNAHIDYAKAKQTRRRNHRAHVLPGNKIPLYSYIDEQYIQLYADKPRHIQITAYDYYGNASILEFKVLRDTEIPEQKQRVFNYKLEHSQPHLLNSKNVKLLFPKNAFYQTQYLLLKNIKEHESNLVSDVYFILDENTPLQDPMEIYIRPHNLDSSLLDKVCVVTCEDKSYTSYGANRKEDMIGARVKKLGKVSLYLDTIPPTITPNIFPYSVSNGSKIQFVIDDNVKYSGDANDLRYRATVNDQWLLFEYDYKSRTITYTVDDRISKGSHKLQLKVWDDRNNISLYEKEFIKK